MTSGGPGIVAIKTRPLYACSLGKSRSVTPRLVGFDRLCIAGAHLEQGRADILTFEEGMFVMKLNNREKVPETICYAARLVAEFTVFPLRGNAGS